MRVLYNPKLKEYARKLRNNSTKSEIKLWQYLKGKQVCGYDFHRQKPIENIIADFFCNKLQLVIELDGITHSEENVYQKDLRKEVRLNQLGITVLRFLDSEVMSNVEGVVERIKMYIEEFERTHPKSIDE